MQRKILLGIIFLILMATLGNWYMNTRTDLVSKLEGKLYYLKRDNEILNIYACNANLSNNRLIYSHKGKGQTRKDDYNDNIINLSYDQAKDVIYFEAINSSAWALFSIKEGDYQPQFIESPNKITDFENDYIKPSSQNAIAVNRNGSMYIVQNGKEKLLKKYYGICDMKFSPGYVPIGFSPDGKYLVYSSTGHLTPIGTMAEGLIKGLFHNSDVLDNYVIDLSTGKSNRFINGQRIQWLM